MSIRIRRMCKAMVPFRLFSCKSSCVVPVGCDDCDASLVPGWVKGASSKRITSTSRMSSISGGNEPGFDVKNVEEEVHT